MRKPYESIIRNTWQWFNSVDGPGHGWLRSRLDALRVARLASTGDPLMLFVCQCWTRKAKHLQSTIVDYVPDSGVSFARFLCEEFNAPKA